MFVKLSNPAFNFIYLYLGKMNRVSDMLDTISESVSRDYLKTLIRQIIKVRQVKIEILQ